MDLEKSSMVHGPSSDKNKKPFIHIWDEGFLRGTTRFTFSSWNVPRFNVLTCQRLFIALTGLPVDDYSQPACVHHPSLPFVEA
jgi:hypothetical protein